MGFASKGYVNSKISAVDSKYAQLITSGTHRLGVWNASTNTPTLSPNSGNNGDWYDVSVEGDWDGRHWRIGDKIIFNSGISKWDQIPTGVEKDDTPMLIGFLTENSSFPTTRPSGKPLLIGDYLKVDSNANLPFELDDGTGTMINFDSYQDEAEWNGTRFQEKSYQAGKTNEVGVKNPAVESPSGNANYQNEVNIEVVNKLKSIKEWEEVDTLNFEGNENTLYYLNKDYEDTYNGLNFRALEDGCSVEFNKYTVIQDFPTDIYYSLDSGKNWTSWDGSSITLNKGKTLSVKNNLNTLSVNDGIYAYFSTSGKLKVFGDISSLINFGELTKNCFIKLFQSTSIIDASELIFPYDTLQENCYESMFKGSDIVNAPNILPAMNLASFCYASMFESCTSLTNAPILPATTLVDSCYYQMFRWCENLTTLPELPATTLADNCYSMMFSSCDNLETISIELPSTTLVAYCYYNMFSGCQKLKNSPELKFTSAEFNSLTQMFNGCTNLNSIKLVYTGNFNSSYFNYWVQGVSQSGTFYYNGSDTTRGESAIPDGWTVETF